MNSGPDHQSFPVHLRQPQAGFPAGCRWPEDQACSDHVMSWHPETAFI
jgi:hypothetical protein